jgi:hypothetical protein
MVLVATVILCIDVSSLSSNQVKVKVKGTLRLTVSQSECLGVKPKSWTFDQNFFFSPQSYCFVFLGCPL